MRPLSVSPVPPSEQNSTLPEKEPSGTGELKVKPQQKTLESRYNDLLKVIGDIGRDVKPAYTNSKVSADRLKKNIMIARGVLRECLTELDKLYSSSEPK